MNCALKLKPDTHPPPGFSVGNKIPLSVINKVLNFLKHEGSYKWTDKDGNITRKTINFGWDYTAMEFGKYTYIPIPPCVQKMRKEIIHSLSDFLPPYAIPEYFDNIIISVYGPEQYLIPHFDADNSPTSISKRNFYFTDPIIGCVLKADTDSSFTFYYHTEEDRPLMDEHYIYKTEESDGITFLIDKECRHFPYFHGIPPVKEGRISITMRRTVLLKDF